MVRIGLIGCGAIGKEIAKTISRDLRGRAALAAVADVDIKKAQALLRSLKLKPAILSIDGVIRKSDLVVEAASARVSAYIAERALSAKKDVLIISTGGLLGKKRLFALADKNRCHLYIPSGAICGIDGVRAASLGRIKEATLKTTKPPQAFGLKAIKKAVVLYRGNAQRAVLNFPQNINIASTLSLAGIGAKKTKVEIAASPKQKTNMHEITVEGDFGAMRVRVENVPSKENIKTSRLAALSASAMLKDIFSYVHIGT